MSLFYLEYKLYSIIGILKNLKKLTIVLSITSNNFNLNQTFYILFYLNIVFKIIF